MDNSKEMVKLAVNALEDKKGEDIQIIDIREVSVLADYFLIASGSNTNQVQAMADNVEETLGKAGGRVRAIESGEVHLDISFIGAPTCDKCGNMRANGGKSDCGVLSYAMVDAQYADKVVHAKCTNLSGQYSILCTSQI